MTVLAGVMHGVEAQTPGPIGADRFTAAEVAESLAVLRDLTARLRTNAHDAEAWYRRGMIAWGLYDRSRRLPPISGLSWPILIHTADTSFQRAIRYAPDSARYFATAARFALATGTRFRPETKVPMLGEALERARAAGHTATLTAALMVAAESQFQAFETTVCRFASKLNDAWTYFPPLEGYPDWARTRGMDYVGEGAYLHAELLLREILDLDPGHTAGFRLLTGLLSEQRRWTDLASLARSVLSHDSTMAWPWLALGLASHRRHDGTAARRAFDRGIALLDSAERHRLVRIERVLPPIERGKYAQASDSMRGVMEEAYWRTVDPLWSHPGVDPRLEFYARLVFAETRWSYPDLGLDGVLSDQGRRYMLSGSRAMSPCSFSRQAWYVLGDTTIPAHRGARWTNVTAGMQIDSIATQIARFRAARGLVDLAIATRLPTQTMVTSTGFRTDARSDFWLLAGGLREVLRDSLAPAPDGVTLRKQMVPPDAYAYRTEVTIDGGNRAARSTGGVIAADDPRSGFTLDGFGMSDVLITASVAGDSRTAAGWRDLVIHPHAGAVGAGGEIGIVWESYGLHQDKGTARYAVAIELSRRILPRGPLPRGNIRATISGARTYRRPDQSFFEVERVGPHRDVIVDHLTLRLGTTPPGEYLLTVRITDRVTNRAIGRSQQLVIAPPPSPPRR